MIKYVLGAILIVLSIQSHAEELTDEKRQVIDDILEITGALEVGKQFGMAIVQQLFGSDDSIPESDKLKLIDAISQFYDSEFINNGWTNQMSHRIYHKYMTLEELTAIRDFYLTPAGRKAAKTLPMVAQEAMQESQAHVQSLEGKIHKLIEDTFKK